MAATAPTWRDDRIDAAEPLSRVALGTPQTSTLAVYVRVRAGEGYRVEGSAPTATRTWRDDRIDATQPGPGMEIGTPTPYTEVRFLHRSLKPDCTHLLQSPSRVERGPPLLFFFFITLKPRVE